MSRTCKVLLVEDLDDDVVLFQRALKRHPAIKLLGPARDGDSAIAYLQGSGPYANRKDYPWPDVVVLDLKLPGRGGFDVLQWMQGRDQRPHVAVFTSSNLPEDRKRAEDLGAILFQQKSLQTEEIDRFLHWVQKFTELNDRQQESVGS